MVIIDFHVHLLGSLERWHPWLRQYVQRNNQDLTGMMNAGSLISYLRGQGVDHAVVLAEVAPVVTGIYSNDEAAAFCQNSPGLIPFASINPYLVARPAQELERCVRDLGLRGIKLLPTYVWFYPNDPALYPLYAKAEEMGIPVMFHTGSSIYRGSRLKYGDPLLLDDVAIDFPHLNIVMSHSGRPLWYNEAFYLACRHERVYMEIAGLPPQKLLEYFPELERNGDKILFGSDWPSVPHIQENIKAVKELPIREDTKAKILGGNAAHILGL